MKPTACLEEALGASLTCHPPFMARRLRQQIGSSVSPPRMNMFRLQCIAAARSDFLSTCTSATPPDLGSPAHERKMQLQVKHDLAWRQGAGHSQHTAGTKEICALASSHNRSSKKLRRNKIVWQEERLVAQSGQAEVVLAVSLPKACMGRAQSRHTAT